MANIVKLKRSAVDRKKPKTTDLQLGELALNTYNGKAWFKKNDGQDVLVELATNPDAANIEVFETTTVTDQDRFTLTNTPLAKEYVFVHLSGVTQSVADYWIEGNDIVLDTPLQAGIPVRITSFLQSSIVGGADIEVKEWTSTALQTDFTMDSNIIGNDYVTVYVSGVAQSSSNYTIVGNTITFGVGLDAGLFVRVVSITEELPGRNVADVELKEFIAGVGQTTYTLDQVPLGKDFISVSIQGVTQSNIDFALSGNDVIISPAPNENDEIRITNVIKLALRGIEGGTRFMTVGGNFTAMSGKSYVAMLDAPATMTLPSNPKDGDTVEVMDGQGSFQSNSLTINRNGKLIQGTASDMILSNTNQSVKLVYLSKTGDWRIARNTSI